MQYIWAWSRVWLLTSLRGKELELVQQVERYQLDIIWLTSTHSFYSGTRFLERGWTLCGSCCGWESERRFGLINTSSGSQAVDKGVNSHHIQVGEWVLPTLGSRQNNHPFWSTWNGGWMRPLLGTQLFYCEVSTLMWAMTARPGMVSPRTARPIWIQAVFNYCISVLDSFSHNFSITPCSAIRVSRSAPGTRTRWQLMIDFIVGSSDL